MFLLVPCALAATSECQCSSPETGCVSNGTSVAFCGCVRNTERPFCYVLHPDLCPEAKASILANGSYWVECVPTPYMPPSPFSPPAPPEPVAPDPSPPPPPSPFSPEPSPPPPPGPARAEPSPPAPHSPPTVSLGEDEPTSEDLAIGLGVLIPMGAIVLLGFFSCLFVLDEKFRGVIIFIFAPFLAVCLLALAIAAIVLGAQGLGIGIPMLILGIAGVAAVGVFLLGFGVFLWLLSFFGKRVA